MLPALASNVLCKLAVILYQRRSCTCRTRHTSSRCQMSSKACKSHPPGGEKVSHTCDWWPVPKDGLVPCFCGEGEATQCIFWVETGEGFCCLVSILLFRLKSFNCGHSSTKGSCENLFEHSSSTLTSSLSRQGCYLLHWAMPSPCTRHRGWALQDIFPSRVSSAPILFVRSHLIRQDSSQNQTGTWPFRVIQVENQTSCPPLQLLAPDWGTRWNKERGRAASPQPPCHCHRKEPVMSCSSSCKMELFQVADSLANCLDLFAGPYVSVRVVFSVYSVKKMFRSESGPQLTQQHSAACAGQAVFSLTFWLMLIDQTHWSQDFTFWGWAFSVEHWISNYLLPAPFFLFFFPHKTLTSWQKGN